jgi:hypothetical protein
VNPGYLAIFYPKLHFSSLPMHRPGSWLLVLGSWFMPMPGVQGKGLQKFFRRNRKSAGNGK